MKQNIKRARGVCERASEVRKRHATHLQMARKLLMDLRVILRDGRVYEDKRGAECELDDLDVDLSECAAAFVPGEEG